VNLCGRGWMKEGREGRRMEEVKTEWLGWILVDRKGKKNRWEGGGQGCFFPLGRWAPKELRDVARPISPVPVCTGWCGTRERKFSRQHHPAIKTPIDPLFPIHTMLDPLSPRPHRPLSTHGSIDTIEFGNQTQQRNLHQ